MHFACKEHSVNCSCFVFMQKWNTVKRELNLSVVFGMFPDDIFNRVVIFLFCPFYVCHSKNNHQVCVCLCVCVCVCVCVGVCVCVF